MGFKDFYGADREGNTLFGTSLVALDANTASVCGTISSWNTTCGIAIHRRHRRSSPFAVTVGTFLL